MASHMVILATCIYALVNGIEGFLFNGHVKHGTNLILVLSFKVISDTNYLLANEMLGLP